MVVFIWLCIPHGTTARQEGPAGRGEDAGENLEKGTVRELGYHKLDAVLGILGLELAPTRARKGAGPSQVLMKRMAQRYIWWQPPEASVADPRRVIAQVMDVGTLEDIQALAKAVGRNTLIGVLKHARPGWFRPRSWAFWHTALGLATAGRIPPIPARRPDALPDPVGGLRIGRVGAPELSDDGVILVASVRDLLATKLKTLFDRVEPKDYLDIAEILARGGDLLQGLSDAGALFGKSFSPAECLRILCWFGEPGLDSLPAGCRRTLESSVKTAWNKRPPPSRKAASSLTASD